MKKFLNCILILLLTICFWLSGCTPIDNNDNTNPENQKFNTTNMSGKLVAYQGVQQEDSLTFANAINIDNQYFFYYFYLGTISKVPLYTSIALQYQYNTEVTFTFNKLTSDSLSNSLSKSMATIDTHSYTGGFSVGFNQEFTTSTEVGAEAEAKIFGSHVKASATLGTSLSLGATEETDHHWTNNWGTTATDVQAVTSSYLNQYSNGYSEKVTFSEDAGFTKGNYYRMSFYETVSAYGVLAYEVATNTYSTTTDFLLKNNSTVRIWEESTNEVFDYQQEKDIEFDVNAAIEYAESHKLELSSSSSELGDNINNPYLISNADDFIKKIKEFDSGNKYFRLTKDLDFSGKTISPISSFYGNLDGAGYTIRNLNMQINSFADLTPTEADAYYIGLFQYVYGKISNLNIEHTTITVSNLNKRLRVGTLTGGLFNGIVYNCSTIGNVKIINSATGNTAWIGGLIGYVENGRVIHCGADVAIEVKNSDVVNCGGLIGRLCGSEIRNSFTKGNIEIDGAEISSDNVYVDAGGLTGRVIKNDDLGYQSKIQNCYAIGEVFCDVEKGKVNVGGLVGRLYDCKVEFVYATGKITARNKTSYAYAAGLIAAAQDSTIVNAFSTSDVFARGNYQGAETNYSFYGHLFASEKNLSLWKLYFDKSASFKSGETGTELKWDTDFYTGVSNTTLKSERFQIDELKLDKSIWLINNGQYPTLL